MTTEHFESYQLDPASVSVSRGACAPDARVSICDSQAGPLAEREPFPPAIAQGPQPEKSAAQWAYERMILYIQNFEKTLDDRHEVGLGFVSSGAGVMRITGMGYFAPDLVTFYGVDDAGMKTQLVQHVSQLNVMLKAAPVAGGENGEGEPRRIGFQLKRDLEGVTEAEPENDAAAPPE